MTGHEQNNQKAPEASIARLIASAANHDDTSDTKAMTAVVLAEVRRERRRRRFRRLATGAGLGGAVAAAVLIAAFWTGPPTGPATAGQMGEFHGIVSLSNGGSPQLARLDEDISAGQWLETRAGSEAEVILADQSRLSLRPRSKMQLRADRSGRELVLQRGSMRLHVTKQPAGTPLRIATPGSDIAVIGTTLDVHVARKPNGRRLTCVSVDSGCVEMTSAGQTVSLRANTEGSAEEEHPPVLRSLTAEVNEMLALMEQSTRLAAKTGRPAGPVAVFEFNDDTSATVWLAVPIVNHAGTPMTEYPLQCGLAGSPIEAHGVDRAAIGVTPEAGAWRLDLAAAPLAPGEQRTVIVRISDVPGIFRTTQEGDYEFVRPASDTAAASLIQLRLPKTAKLEQVTPEPLSTRRTPSRLVVTLSAEAQLPSLCK